MKLVERTILIKAPPSEVYAHFVQPDLFVRWMAVEATIDPHEGGRIFWRHQNGDTCSGVFVELEPPRRIVFTYGWDRADVGIPAGSTTVEITLTPEGTDTRVDLVHRGLPEPQVGPHDGGWANYLQRLAEIGLGGDPGPDPLADQRVPGLSDLDQPSQEASAPDRT